MNSFNLTKDKEICHGTNLMGSCLQHKADPFAGGTHPGEL